VQLPRDSDVFKFCYKGESTLNSIQLGQFSHFQRKENALVYIGTPGDKCGETNYRLEMEFECDQTLEKRSFIIPSFTLGDGNCSVHGVFRLRDACKISWLNPNPKGIHPIRCVSKAVYDAGIAAVP
jgi:hypothetical protein